MADYIVPVGPQSPAMKESMLLKIHLDGHTIRNVEMYTGYMHRGVERIMEGRDVNSALYIATRICGICSYAHEAAYTRTIEEIAGINVPKNVRLMRTVLMELERIQSHLLWAGYMLYEIGFKTLFHYFWRERERVLNVVESMTGNRIHYNLNKPGTLRRALSFDVRSIEPVDDFVADYIKEVRRNHIIRSRFRSVGHISRELAQIYLVGPNARASGVRNIDIRVIDPWDGYADLNIREVRGKEGDAYERLLVRLREIRQAIEIAAEAAGAIRSSHIPPFKLIAPSGRAIGRVEAPRGELFYYLNVQNGRIVRAKIRTPSFDYMQILPKILIGERIGDIPVIIASLDPCFSCMERVLIADESGERLLTERQFREEYVCGGR